MPFLILNAKLQLDDVRVSRGRIFFHIEADITHGKALSRHRLFDIFDALVNKIEHSGLCILDIHLGELKFIEIHYPLLFSSVNMRPVLYVQLLYQNH